MGGEGVVAEGNTSCVPSVAAEHYTSASVVFQSCATEDDVMTVVDVQSCF